jgi:hypothetical protein
MLKDPKYLQIFPKSSKVSFIIASRRGMLEKYLLQNPREENENGWKERERERESVCKIK